MNKEYTDLITIAIPVYERIEFFEEAFLSAVNQTVSCPILVIDNNSTHDFFKNYVAEFNSNGIVKAQYIRNSNNVGMIENWNNCIKFSTTPFVSILHDDDALHSLFVELSIKEISNGRDFFSFDALIQWENILITELDTCKKVRVYRFNSTLFLLDNLSPFPGVVFSVEKARTIGGFSDNVCYAPDFDFWIRLGKICKCYKITLPLAFYRTGVSQETYKIVPSTICQLSSIRENIQYYWLFKYISLYKTYELYKFYKTTYSMDLNNIDDIKLIDKYLYKIFKRFLILDNVVFLKKGWLFIIYLVHSFIVRVNKL